VGNREHNFVIKVGNSKITLCCIYKGLTKHQWSDEGTIK